MIAAAVAKAAGFGLAAGAWAVNLAILPPFYLYALALYSGAKAFHDYLDVEAEAFSRAFGDQIALARRQELERRAAA